jgi:hypothetical protein
MYSSVVLGSHATVLLYWIIRPLSLLPHYSISLSLVSLPEKIKDTHLRPRLMSLSLRVIGEISEPASKYLVQYS